MRSKRTTAVLRNKNAAREQLLFTLVQHMGGLFVYILTFYIAMKLF